MLPHQPPSDTPAYGTVHRHARRRIADTCAHCGSTERLQAALKQSTPTERILVSPLGLRYSANLDDYEALCVPCHRHQDIGEGRPDPVCRNGHPLTPDNVKRRASGRRACLTCYRASYKRWNDKVAARTRGGAA